MVWRCLLNFSHHHIEMCTLLEICGWFLFRSPELYLRISVLLEQMTRKKQVIHLDIRCITMVENVYYYCDPPSKDSEKETSLSAICLETCRRIFLRSFWDWCRKILRLMWQLPRKDHEVKDFVTDCMIDIWDVKYSGIHYIAKLLVGAVCYQKDIGIHIIEGILKHLIGNGG